jgi:phosphoserine aminotransferase
MLPEDVLTRAGKNITDFNGSGQSVMEMSHRSKVFLEIFNETKASLREVLSVPDTHEILFLQGGATLQFAAVPFNLTAKKRRADYAITGNFSNLAYKEAQKFAFCNVAWDTSDKNHTYIPTQEQLRLDPGAAYFYYCANNTIYGTEWQYTPQTEVPLVADMSSNILTKNIDFSKYDVVFAGAQKNMAPAGVTCVIVNKAAAGHALDGTPVMLDYGTMVKSDSMHNTPPCWSIYILGEVLKWVKEQGGIAGMEQLKKARAGLLYDFIDNSRLFRSPVNPADRSPMNVVFVTGDAELDKKFVKEAESKGLVNIAGHRSVGGMRASMYNAMPIEGAKTLVEFMKEFEKANV